MTLFLSLFATGLVSIYQEQMVTAHILIMADPIPRGDNANFAFLKKHLMGLGLS